MRIVLKPEHFLCNMYQGSNKDLINLINLIKKQYIYACKCNKSRLQIMNLILKIYDMKNLEYIVALKSNRLFQYNVKWFKLDNLFKSV